MGTTVKNVAQVRKAVLKEFEKEFPGEELYGKVFSLYLLDRYSKLLYKLYQKAGTKREK